MRILLAEDDTNISVIMQICLEKIGGHQVVHCADGLSAIAAAQSAEFDLLILDGMMPGLSGLEVAAKIREQNRSTPIIFLSAKSDANAVSDFLRIGAGFLSKPFEPQTICSKIDEIMLQAGKRAA